MKQYLIAGFVIAIFLTLSFLLVPRKAELGLMYKKGRQYELAKYELKKQASKGDLSISITIPLMELYLHFGEIYQAIDLLERFVDENPKDDLAREMLGDLYRDGMMPHKYIFNLEKTTLQEPTEKRLRELIHLHQTRGLPGKALGFLKTLIERFPANSKDTYKLAFLQAKSGKLSEALLTLKTFEAEHPQLLSIDIKELQVHLLLNLNEIDQSHEIASTWLSKNFSYSSLTRLVQLFRSKNQNSSALQLMKTFNAQVKNSAPGTGKHQDRNVKRVGNRASLGERGQDLPNEALVRLLRDEYIDLQFQNLTKKEALAKMSELSKREQLPASLVNEYIDLAMELEALPLLFEIVLQTAPEKVDKESLLNLSEVALRKDAGHSMEKVLERFGDEFLSDQPLLGARLMDHLNDRESTLRWLQKAEAQPDLSLDQQIDLNHFYKKLGIPEKANIKSEALAKMKALVEKEQISDSLMQEYIDLALELKEYSLLFDIALQTAPGKGDRELLLNLSEITLRTDALGSMKKVLERFGDEFLSGQPLLGVRLMDHLGDRKATFRWLREVEAQPDLTLDQQIDLIHLYNKLGVPERAKDKLDKNRLQNLITQKLEEPGLLPAGKKELIHVLIQLEAFNPALPHLKTLAETEGGDWKFYYVKALKHLNRTKQLAGFWKDQAKKKNLSKKEKRDIASQLLENNLKGEAESLLKSLAENTSPKSPDVLQLLFLWGPSATPENLNWMIAQARAARGNDFAGWMKHLIQVGAARDAVTLTKTRNISDQAVFESYLQALQALESKEEVIREMSEKLLTEDNRDHLLGYAKLAEELEMYETAVLTFQKILEVNPDDDKTIRKLGVIHYHQKNWKRAEFYLQKSLNKDREDWKTRFYYAEAVFLQGKKSAAEKHYLKILGKIQNSPKRPFELQLARATCLHRLRRKKEALLAYENLVNQNPTNKVSRASFIAALMDFREFDRAQALLESP